MRIIIVFLLIFFINLPAIAKNKDNNFDYNKHINKVPIFPQSKVYDLKDIINIRMRVHLTEASFDKVCSFYMKKMIEKGWVLEFPTDFEYKIWMEALDKDKTKTPNLMIGMIDPKTKVNCNLSIGVVKDARLAKDFTIVTIYLTSTMLR